MFQLLFVRDMILLIKHTLDWELMRQKNLSKINKDNIHKSSKRVDRDYRVGNIVMIINNDAFKYDIPYKVPFEII